MTYTYPGDVHVTLTSTQFIEGAWDVAMRYFGTQGNAEARYDAPVRIIGQHAWEYPGLGAPAQINDAAKAATGAFTGALDDADAKKEQQFIGSIVSGNFLNEAAQGAESTMTAILGRTAAYGPADGVGGAGEDHERWDAGSTSRTFSWKRSRPLLYSRGSEAPRPPRSLTVAAP